MGKFTILSKETLFLIFLNFLVFSCFVDALFAQTISGRVLDDRTGKPLPFSNVFISNTTLGSITDINGFYTISGQLPQNFELVGSFMGYFTKVKNVEVFGRTNIYIDFELVPKVDQLEEVELKAKRDKKWERNYKRFEKVFLAVPDDPFLKENRILNPWVLNFEEYNEKGVKYFTASAQEPIHIENRSLGYNVNYYLQYFLESRRGFHYNGLVNFQEMKGIEGVELVRNSTYQGSLRHFIQSLINNKIDTLEFEIYQVLPEKFDNKRTNNFDLELGKSIARISRDSLYICELSNSRIKINLPYRIEVHNLKMPWPSDYYQQMSHSIFWLEAPKGYFIADEFGILRDPNQLVRSGFIGRERLARFLPHDFKPSTEFGELLATFDSTLVEKNKWNSLRERPHISLNKSFYAPGEALWFSAQTLYQNTLISDSLSRVLYIDLYGEDFKLIKSEKYEIDKGHVSGVLEIPDQASKGDYVLRAYTNWSRNYGEDGFTYLPVPILPSDQLAVADSSEEWVDPEGEIEVNIEGEFLPSEWNTIVKLKINLSEPDLEIKGGILNISVLDADLNPAIGLHPTISKSLDWLLEHGNEILYTPPQYPIEFGISIEGYFSDRPGKPMEVPITIVKGELEDYGVVKSDSRGFFRATGLSFTDTAEIAIAALNPKRKRFGQIHLTPSQLPDVTHYYPRLTYRIEANPFADFKFKYSDLMEGVYFELEEFTVSNTAIGDASSNNYGYGTPDRTIRESQLEAWPALTLDRIISMNMPGGGMGLYNWGTKTGGPLLLIDGARYLESSDTTDTVMDYLSTFVAAEIESIKVYTFSATTFGMQGYAGAILIETKKGSREKNKNLIFDDSQFQKFKVSGFTKVPSFPDFENYQGVISRKPAVYWNPKLEWDEDQTSIPISFEMSSQTKKLLVKIEGLSNDKDPISKIFYLEVNHNTPE